MDNIGCNEVQSIATDLETTSDTASLTFTAHEDATFTCRLDRKLEWNVSTVTLKLCCIYCLLFYRYYSPHTYTGLSKGKHKIVVVSKCPGERTGINAKVDFRLL